MVTLRNQYRDLPMRALSCLAISGFTLFSAVPPNTSATEKTLMELEKEFASDIVKIDKIFDKIRTLKPQIVKQAHLNEIDTETCLNLRQSIRNSYPHPTGPFIIKNIDAAKGLDLPDCSREAWRYFGDVTAHGYNSSYGLPIYYAAKVSTTRIHHRYYYLDKNFQVIETLSFHDGQNNTFRTIDDEGGLHLYGVSDTMDYVTYQKSKGEVLRWYASEMRSNQFERKTYMRNDGDQTPFHGFGAARLGLFYLGKYYKFYPEPRTHLNIRLDNTNGKICKSARIVAKPDSVTYLPDQESHLACYRLNRG